MIVYAVVATFDEDGVWIYEEESNEYLFASLELAENHKIQVDQRELEAHNAREAVRYERWARTNAAKAILQANNFEGIEEAIPYSKGEFVPYEWKSKIHIIPLQVQE